MIVQNSITIINDDCMKRFNEIKDKSVSAIITDPPYGITNCKWDCLLDLDKMWIELKRIIKDDGTIVIFGKNPFSANLISKNYKMYKYDWVYEKSHATGHLNCKKMPMQKHELIHVFQNSIHYFPVIEEKIAKNVRPESVRKNTESYGRFKNDSKRTIPKTMSYPSSILKFNKDQTRYHPTQKPVPLLQYLIKSYTQEGDLVLDFTMGSGTTGVAAKTTNRRFLGIEKEKEYFEIAKRRIHESQ